MTRRSQPRAHKTPGRMARHVGRELRGLRMEHREHALRDRAHASKRTPGWTPGKRRALQRLQDVRRFEQAGRAGAGQRKSAGPRTDIRVRHEAVPGAKRKLPRGAMGPLGPQRRPRSQP